MGPQIIASAHAPVEITKSQKLGLQYAVLEAAVFFTSLEWNERSSNSTKNSNRGIEVSLIIFIIITIIVIIITSLFILA